ncbi:MAG: calcium/sodium antiporter [Akkermansiaceae bacterium]|jgi:cation:H+ antiporter|nr:calcium/sodium antiporter [Akkermansiaceae bacterium]MDP4647190.1 calcium/sodium antiporter [Akkermansiaceae bacterium]MDP4720108.1 calcium/sodium antiporter [Akkermansiaceae bacterium]MDP4780933.1 calcium/sodium antiporter [Akkermansiaceae bacterium]MDP4845756.1 calcium/sodium antiporter [Akkermansiaceae bacterium]
MKRPGAILAVFFWKGAAISKSRSIRRIELCQIAGGCCKQFGCEGNLWKNSGRASNLRFQTVPDVSNSLHGKYQILLIILGAILLYFGAEGLVRGSASLATRLGVSPLIAGLTIVAFGTSAPELSVSLSSALEGHSDIALGNVIGSNIFNIAVILGIAALIQPMKIHLAVIRRDIPVMIVASAIAFALIISGSFSRMAGCGLLLGLGAYLYFTIRSAKSAPVGSEENAMEAPPLLSSSWLIDTVVLLAGLGVLILGSRLFVDGATSFAKTMGVSDAVIGLTVVAVGTSLPELATSVVAALRKQSDIAIGNVVGSNIFNVFCILGVTATVSPINASEIGLRDGVVMLLIALILLPFAMTGRRISRSEGAVFLVIYAVYLVLLWPKG